MKSKEERFHIITSYVPGWMVKKIGYIAASRSKFIRDALTELFESEENELFEQGQPSESIVFTANIPMKYIQKMEKWLDNGVFFGRSEIIRYAIIKKLLKEEETERRIERALRLMDEKEKEERVEVSGDIITYKVADAYKSYKIIPKHLPEEENQ